MHKNRTLEFLKYYKIFILEILVSDLERKHFNPSYSD